MLWRVFTLDLAPQSYYTLCVIYFLTSLIVFYIFAFLIYYAQDL